MIQKIVDEGAFQVLSDGFSISPSTTGYILQVSANGSDFSDLFSVASGQTRMVTGIANGSYFRCKNNVGELTINWQRECCGGGGGTGAGVSSLNGQTGPLNVKTINGEDILGTGDIEIQGGELPIASEETLGGIKVGENLSIDENGVLSAIGGGGDANIVELTQEEYDALEEKDPSAIYVITDADIIDMEDYVTKDEFDEKVTETVMPALEQKANKQNVTAGYGVPKWNAEGVIESKQGDANTQYIYINDSICQLWKTNSWYGGNRIYTPTATGSKGQILVSSGSGTPVWESAIKSVKITQDAYDALVDAGTVDANTLYLIVEE